MNPSLDLAISILTAGSMLAVGLEIEFNDVYYVFRRKLLLLRLLLSQMIVLPALAILVIHFTFIPEGLKPIVLILFACLTGNIASFFTLLARGNLALSVASSACSCLLAPLVMPITFLLYGQLSGSSTVLAIPQGVLLARIFVITWIPIIAGILLRRVSLNGVAAFSLLLQKAGAAGIFGLCIYIFVTRFRDLTLELKANLITSTTLIVISIVAGAIISHSLKEKRGNSICYITAYPARNFGILAVSVAAMHRVEGLDLGSSTSFSSA
jgi:BASS family bile acid:Na+ symporter